MDLVFVFFDHQFAPTQSIMNTYLIDYYLDKFYFVIK